MAMAMAVAVLTLGAPSPPSILPHPPSPLHPPRPHPPSHSSFSPFFHRNAVVAAALSDPSNYVPRKRSDDLEIPGFGLFNTGNFGSGTTTPPAADELQPRQAVECPPGLKHYETMAVLRPDINEDQRLAFTQRYEEAIITGGGMGVEVFNRGMMPLAYNIKKKNMAGISNKYLDGIYYLFTYFTKPESQTGLEKKFNTDDDIIRSFTFKIKPVRAERVKHVEGQGLLAL